MSQQCDDQHRPVADERDERELGGDEGDVPGVDTAVRVRFRGREGSPVAVGPPDGDDARPPAGADSVADVPADQQREVDGRQRRVDAEQQAAVRFGASERADLIADVQRDRAADAGDRDSAEGGGVPRS